MTHSSEETESFVYQPSPLLTIIFGCVPLAMAVAIACGALFDSSGGSIRLFGIQFNPPESYFVYTGVCLLLLAISAWIILTALSRKRRPIRVVLEKDSVVIPSLVRSQPPKRVGYADIEQLRREPLRGAQGTVLLREVLYIYYCGKREYLQPDLFGSKEAFTACAQALSRRCGKPVESGSAPG